MEYFYFSPHPFFSFGNPQGMLLGTQHKLRKHLLFTHCVFLEFWTLVHYNTIFSLVLESR